MDWRVSLHGGHSGPYCDHGSGELRDFLERAVELGFSAYGLTDHAPRLGEQYLYDKERGLGWDVARLERNFEAYAKESAILVREFADRLTVLRGFEAEVVPSDRYVDLMLDYRKRYDFEYMVGSVHYVDDVSIDGEVRDFERALATQGGLENLAIRYYQILTEMVDRLRPEVVGHLDLIRKRSGPYGPVDTPAIRDAAEKALEAISRCGAILDVNTAGYRKGLDTPYPAPWLVRRAWESGIGLCMGDDSHSPDDVGLDMDLGRAYLLELDVTEVTILTRAHGTLVQRRVPLS